MQKILRRTAEAQRRVASRFKKQSEHNFRKEQAENRRETKENLQAIAQDLKDARKARREAWELGPLAPRRNVDGYMSYAAQSGSRLASTHKLKDWQKRARDGWARSPKGLCLAVGDRVVVIEGPEKGTIDKISQIHEENATVELQDAARRLVQVPELYRRLNKEQTPTMAAAAKIPISAIRLVHPLTDPASGVTRDVIIQSLTHGRDTYENEDYKWGRYVTGQNISIPWPEKVPVEHENHPCDTRREDVETATFEPTLLHPPMPEQLIDELRNPYSKFRTRHTQEYIDKMDGQTADRKARHKQHLEMRTPVQEFNQKQRAMRRARGQPKLSTEMYAKIGELVARNKATALNSAGLSEVSSQSTLP